MAEKKFELPTYKERLEHFNEFGGTPPIKAENTPAVFKSTIVSKPLADPSNKWKSFLCFEKIHADALIPRRATTGSAGHDIFALADFSIEAHGQTMVATGITMKMPPGHYGQIAPRSGLAAKNSIAVMAGIIDEDYTGEIKVILFNHSAHQFNGKKNQAIAQLIIIPYVAPPIKEVSDMHHIFGGTQRGNGGFGSTG